MGSIRFDIPPELHQRLKRVAVEKNESLYTMLIAATAAYVSSQEKQLGIKVAP